MESFGLIFANNISRVKFSLNDRRMPNTDHPGQSRHFRVRMNLNLIAVITIILSMAVGCINVESTEAQESEYMIKAAFLYNFSKFVDWPEGSFKDDLSPIRLFILGADPFGNTLDSIRDKAVKGRNLTIKRIQKVEEAAPCHILFLSPSEKGNVRQIIQSLGSVLTVSEIPRFCQSGGMINFIKVEDKIQFEINPDAAQQKKLTISSRLLKLARIVGTETQRGKE